MYKIHNMPLNIDLDNRLTNVTQNFFFFAFEFYFIFKLYITVLVLSNIKMNPPQVYMYSPSRTPSLLPPHSIPLGRFLY